MLPIPFFSIVVPMYNRERVITRALRSCIAQDFDDFEVLVVDDGSTDKSLSAANAIHDPRIRVLHHEFNRGVGPARNTGIEAACGEWIVCLDSDDELLPGGLRAIFRRANEVGGGVDGLRFSCRLDDGRTSPNPPLIESIWNYEAYLRWIERTRDGLQETMPVVRRRTFEFVRYASDRALESTYHLDFSKHFLTQTCPDVVRLYHLDAHNRLTAPDVAQLLSGAQDQARSIEYLISEHGAAMECWAPTVIDQHMAGVITLHLLAGNRIFGLRALRRYCSRSGISAKASTVTVLGLIDRRLLATVKTFRTRLATRIA